MVVVVDEVGIDDDADVTLVIVVVLVVVRSGVTYTSHISATMAVHLTVCQNSGILEKLTLLICDSIY